MTTPNIIANSPRYQIVTIARRRFYPFKQHRKMVKSEFDVRHVQEISPSTKLSQATNDLIDEKGQQCLIKPKTGLIHFRYHLANKKVTNCN